MSTIFVDVHDAFGADLVGATSGTLTYNTTIKQEYVSTGLAVLANDNLGGTVTMNYSTPGNGANCPTTSFSGVSIAPVMIMKEIVNLQPEYDPGDIITYRLTMDIPSGDSRDVMFTDYFPLPVLNVTNFTLTWGTNIRYVTGSGYITGSPPTITKNIATNSLNFVWGQVFTGMSGTLAIEIDIPITIEPFADNLFHSNIFEAETSNTSAVTATDASSVLVQIFAPQMTIDKSVIATDNGNISNGNLNNADAGDVVTFRITAENNGGAPAYDVTIKDNPPSEFTNCNLVSVTRGNGSTNIPYTGDLFTTGIVLNTPVQESGSGGPTQQDIAEVVYTCVLDQSVIPREEITNTCLLYTSPSPRDGLLSRMPSSA